MKRTTAFSLLFIVAALLTLLSFQRLRIDDRSKIAQEMEQSLQHMLNSWYPQSIDTLHGGFLTSFTFDFKPTGAQDKMIVTQARHTWTNAKASKLYPDKPHFQIGAAHGFAFLKDVMWDKTHGGFYWLVNRQGKEAANQEAPKTAYGNAFGIYALAAYYAASRDTAALNFAKTAFMWLDKHAHDPIHKGYFQHMQADGTPIKRTATVPSTSNLGYKDQNSSIHLLEAFTELYSVWPDPLVRERLEEMLLLVRDKITSPKGYLVLFLQPDWTPVSFRDSSKASIARHHSIDHVSFGHDVETAYLMTEASHVLGLKNDVKTISVAKKMVDHALLNGWDKQAGGFYDEGYYFKGNPKLQVTHQTKNWWAQAESLNTLLMMADRFPKDKMQYYKKFQQLWNYAQTYLIDKEYGDWYEGGIDKEPIRKTGNKGHMWKATYHQYRSLANCIQQLRQPAISH